MKCRHLFPKKMRMFIEDKRKGKASLRYNELSFRMWGS